jgi:ferredoxin, 2Fe-2S
MPKVSYVQPDGSERVIDGVTGDTVMSTAVKNGVSGIIGQCGGSLSCATCHVYLAEEDQKYFGVPSEDEDDMLDCSASDREDTSRLSCQLVLQDGVDLHVTIPEEQA